MQELLVILVVGACAAAVGVYVWRFFHPAPGRACGGNCCNASKTPQPPVAAEAPKSAVQTVFFRADDLVARVKARRR